jgi:ribosomal protein S18 acetylase RimI-like enzyme
MTHDLVETLEWDTQFFGINVGRVTEPDLQPEQLKLVHDQSRDHGIQLLYWLASPLCKNLGSLASESGFRFMDFRLEFDIRIAEDSKASPPPLSIRPYEEKDIQSLVEIAHEVHTDSRFYLDPIFRDQSPRLFEKWIERDVSRSHGIVFVADIGEGACGYCTCHAHPNQADVGQIGLVGVHPQAAGKGLGKNLIATALRWFENSGFQSVSVATQGANIAAQRLYQNAGFKTRSSGVWFHKTYCPTIT